MDADAFKYILIAVYVSITYALSLVGMRKTRSLAGFSIGNKDMSPYLIGITMAASIASTATFVINPGFVYTHGLSALVHYGIAAYLGIAAALLLLCKGFREIGAQTQALTIPHWIQQRYQSRALSLFFAFANLLSITFVVLILVGCAILCASLFQISQQAALILIMLFVFSYVLLGGTYAHAYTNCFQGIMMALIALVLFFDGLDYFSNGFFVSLSTVSENYAAVFNPASDLYYDFFSVLGSSFLITFALMMQPHILTKVLYLKEGRDVSRFLTSVLVVALIFSLMLFVGLFARLKGIEVESQDQVVAHYIAESFSDSTTGKLFLAFVSVALLAAGMSTLDGILVALSSIVVNDIYLPLRPGAATQSGGLALSRIVLVVVGLIALFLAWDPPRFVGLFAQKGVYGLAAASVAPITLGVLLRNRPPAWLMGLSAGIGLGGHLLLHLVFGVRNPSVSASYALLFSFAVAALFLTFGRLRR